MASRIFLCFLFCLTLWLAGLAWFVWQIPYQPVEGNRQADAIVVLTGGSGRLEYGLKLLADGKGHKLFISGVSEGVTTEMLLKQVPEDIRARLTPSDIEHIALGYKAENTIGNAEETARWLKRQGYRSIRLVTANYHMPRSIREFAEAAPDIAVIPAPVFPDNFTLTGWWNDIDSRVLVLSEYNKFLVSELRHFLIPSRVSGGGGSK